MTKPRDLAESVNAGSIPASRLVAQSIGNSQISTSAAIESTKLQFTQAGANAVPYSVQNKLRQTVSVVDFGADPTGNVDATAAIQAAIDSVAGYGTVVFPGKFRVSSTISFTAGVVELVGDGSEQSGTIEMTASQRIFDVTLVDASSKLLVRNMTIFPTANDAAVPSFIRLTVPFSPSSPYCNFIAENVTSYSFQPVSGLAPRTLAKMFELINCWAPRLYNCFHFPRTLQPAVDGEACLVWANRTLDMTLTNCVQHYGDALVYVGGYSEGVNLLNCTVVGCNWAISQGSYSPDPGNGLKLLQIMATSCEINAYKGSFNLDRVKYLHAVNCSHTQHQPSFGGWTAYNLLDVQDATCIGDIFVGGASIGGGQVRTAIKLRYGARSTDYNVWIGPVFESSLDKLADIGANVFWTRITSALSNVGSPAVNPLTKVDDLGINTTVEFNGNQFGGSTVWLSNGGPGDLSIAKNLWSDGSNKYVRAGAAAVYRQNTSGEHLWFTAASGSAGATASLSELMKLDASGNLKISNTLGAPTTPTGGGVLYVSGGALFFRGSGGTITPIAPA